MHGTMNIKLSKAVLRYKLLTLDDFHLDTQYLHEQGCKDPLLFIEAKGVHEKKMSGKH